MVSLSLLRPSILFGMRYLVSVVVSTISIRYAIISCDYKIRLSTSYHRVQSSSSFHLSWAHSSNNTRKKAPVNNNDSATATVTVTRTLKWHNTKIKTWKKRKQQAFNQIIELFSTTLIPNMHSIERLERYKCEK